MSPQASGGFVKIHKSSLGFRGHLITNFPNVMVLLIIKHSHLYNTAFYLFVQSRVLLFNNKFYVIYTLCTFQNDVNIKTSERRRFCLKVAPCSFLKSGKHMFQTENLVHSYFIRRMKPTVWYITAFWKSETATKKCVTVVAMATMTFQNGC